MMRVCRSSLNVSYCSPLQRFLNKIRLSQWQVVLIHFHLFCKKVQIYLIEAIIATPAFIFERAIIGDAIGSVPIRGKFYKERMRLFELGLM